MRRWQKGTLKPELDVQTARRRTVWTCRRHKAGCGLASARLLLVAILAAAGLLGVIAEAVPTPAVAQIPSPSPAPAGQSQAADLEQQGLDRFQSGDAAGALDLLTKALDQAGADQSREASIRLGRGVVFYSLGRYAEALDDYQKALQIRQRAGDNATIAQLQSNIGIVYLGLGQYEDALKAFTQALDIRFGLNDRAGQGETLNGIGAVYLREGQYIRALSTFQLARRNREAARDTAGQGETLSNIALTYNKLGQNDEAQKAYEQALTLARAAGDRAGEAETLNNIGLLLVNEGKIEQGLDSLRQARALTQALGRRLDEAQILDSLGNAYFSAGRFNEALQPLQEALAIERPAGDRPDQVATLVALARVQLNLGQREAARASALEAQSLAGDLGDETAKGAAADVLGQIAEQAGDFEQALRYDNDAIAAEENVRAATRLEDFKSGVASQIAALYQRTVLLYLKQGESGKTAAFDLSERARARSFLDQLGNARLIDSSRADPRLIREVQSLRDAIGELSSRLRQEHDAGRFQALIDERTAKERSYEDATARLRVSDPESASLISVAPQRAADIQALLDGQTSLISYLVTPEKTLAFIITAGDLQEIDLPFRQADLEADIKSFRDSVAGTPAPGRMAPPDESLRRLYGRLIAPLNASLTTPQVGIIPYGILNYLPFAALIDTSNSGAGVQYFGEQKTLFTLPSASALRFVHDKRKSTANTLLALGEGQAWVGEGFPVLNTVDAEAEAIADLYGGRALTHGAAKATAFEAQAGNYAILHLAAHGDLHAAAPLFSRILLAPDDQSHDDGSLSVEQVYGLKLTNAELVVLSACQTQLGQTQFGGQNQGDDLVSLSRAFLYAGSPSVIASLWNVNDASTSQLMTAFYRHLKAGMSKAQALQAAQADTRVQYPNPFYWAPFVLSGDPGLGANS